MPMPAPRAFVRALLGISLLLGLLTGCVTRLALSEVQPSPAPTDRQSPLPPSTPRGPGSPTAQSAVSSAPLTATGTLSPTEVIGQIRIPKLQIDRPVVEVSWHLEQVQGQTLGVWETASGAAGHHRGTAAPGTAGNCVLSGHSREGAETGVFYGLWELELGDEVLLVNQAGQEYTYEIERLIKLEELGQDLAQRYDHAALMEPSTEARLTLITCWPDWAYTHRIVAIARLKR